MRRPRLSIRMHVCLFAEAVAYAARLGLSLAGLVESALLELLSARGVALPVEVRAAVPPLPPVPLERGARESDAGRVQVSIRMHLDLFAEGVAYAQRFDVSLSGLVESALLEAFQSRGFGVTLPPNVGPLAPVLPWTRAPGAPQRARRAAAASTATQARVPRRAVRPRAR